MLTVYIDRTVEGEELDLPAPKSSPSRQETVNPRNQRLPVMHFDRSEPLHTPKSVYDPTKTPILAPKCLYKS